MHYARPAPEGKTACIPQFDVGDLIVINCEGIYIGYIKRIECWSISIFFPKIPPGYAVRENLILFSLAVVDENFAIGIWKLIKCNT